MSALERRLARLEARHGAAVKGVVSDEEIARRVAAFDWQEFERDFNDFLAGLSEQQLQAIADGYAVYMKGARNEHD